MSQAASMGFLPCLTSHPASLAAMVVLPAPCRPQSIYTVNGPEDQVSLALVPPISWVISSLTILITCWEAVSDPVIS